MDKNNPVLHESHHVYSLGETLSDLMRHASSKVVQGRGGIASVRGVESLLHCGNIPWVSQGSTRSTDAEVEGTSHVCLEMCGHCIVDPEDITQGLRDRIESISMLLV